MPALAAVALMTVLGAAPAAAAGDQAGLLRQAAQAEQAGRLVDAAALYDRARQASPLDGDAQRGACEVGIKLAGRASVLSAAAVEGCHKAYLITHSPRDTRNKVEALLLEKAKPDLDALAVASLMADGAVKSAPDQLWGHLARHDIARHLGRADLLEQSRKALEPFSSEPIVRAALDDRAGAAPVWVWLLRIVVLLGLIGTAAHASTHRRRGASSDEARPDEGAPTATSSSRPAAVLVVLLSLLASSRALAADMPDMKDGQISPFKIDDAHPEEALKSLLQKTKDPLQLGYLLQDLGAGADTARMAGDHARAARYYHALAIAVDTAFAPRMECQSYEKAGDVPKAIPACRETLLRKGVVVNDYTHFVEVVLQNPTPLPELEPKELEGVIAHLEKEAKIGSVPAVLRCKVAMRFEDSRALARCEEAVKAFPAEDPTVISIKWGLAVRRLDQAGARLLVQQAEKAGVSPDGIARMRATTDAISERRFKKVKVIAGLAVFALAVGFACVRLLSALRRRTASQSAV